MLRRMHDERPYKADDQGLSAISETFKNQPIGFNFKIKMGGAMNDNFILRVNQHSLKTNG